MEIQNIKKIIQETYFKKGKFNKKELYLYKKFLDKFDCKFKRVKPIPTDYNELHLNVRLKKKIDNLEELAKELEKNEIKLGKEKSRYSAFPRYRSIEYENASLDCSDEKKKKYRLNYKKNPTHATIYLK